jgi:hypothetical protein
MVRTIDESDDRGHAAMKLMQRMECAMKVIDTALTIAKFIVALTAALAGFSAVVAVVAYLKREQWTKPAYTWARHASGRWSVTPWAS